MLRVSATWVVILTMYARSAKAILTNHTIDDDHGMLGSLNEKQGGNFEKRHDYCFVTSRRSEFLDSCQKRHVNVETPPTIYTKDVTLFNSHLLVPLSLHHHPLL